MLVNLDSIGGHGHGASEGGLCGRDQKLGSI